MYIRAALCPHLVHPLVHSICPRFRLSWLRKYLQGRRLGFGCSTLATVRHQIFGADRPVLCRMTYERVCRIKLKTEGDAKLVPEAGTAPLSLLFSSSSSAVFIKGHLIFFVETRLELGPHTHTHKQHKLDHKHKQSFKQPAIFLCVQTAIAIVRAVTHKIF